jgi:hypothetical protein
LDNRVIKEKIEDGKNPTINLKMSNLKPYIQQWFNNEDIKKQSF